MKDREPFPDRSKQSGEGAGWRLGWRGRQARFYSPKASPKQRVCLSILSFPCSEMGPHLGDRKAMSPGAMVSRGPGGRVAARKVWSGLMGSNSLVEEAGSARVRPQRIAHAATASGDEGPRVRIGRALGLSVTPAAASQESGPRPSGPQEPNSANGLDGTGRSLSCTACWEEPAGPAPW